MIAAIVVAAGSGARLGAVLPKALVPIAGAPLVSWSLRALDRCAQVAVIVVAAPAEHQGAMRDAVPAGQATPVIVVAGGSSRQRSVAAAMAVLPADVTIVLVHDAARPLLTAAVCDGVIAALDGVDGAIAASPVTDTLKRGDSDGVVVATVDRADLWAAQTPQGFHTSALRAAFAAAGDRELDTATDCAAMVEARGGRVRLVPTATPNLKVTVPADLAIVGALLRPE